MQIIEPSRQTPRRQLKGFRLPSTRAYTQVVTTYIIVQHSYTCNRLSSSSFILCNFRLRIKAAVKYTLHHHYLLNTAEVDVRVNGFIILDLHTFDVQYI